VSILCPQGSKVIKRALTSAALPLAARPPFTCTEFPSFFLQSDSQGSKIIQRALKSAIDVGPLSIVQCCFYVVDYVARPRALEKDLYDEAPFFCTYFCCLSLKKRCFKLECIVNWCCIAFFL